MATRKKPAKKVKEPLVRCGGTMTESAYLAWIRSALRSKSLRWPPRAHALELARRPYKGPNKRQKWEYLCVLCTKWHNAKTVIVDHHPVAAGSILSVADIGPFANNLYCEVDNLRVLCDTCHLRHTLAEANGISMAEAAILQETIAICKKKVKDVIDFGLSYGYTKDQLSNAEKRRAIIHKILKEHTK